MKPPQVAIVGAVAAPVGRYTKQRGSRAPIAEQDLLVDVSVHALRAAKVSPVDIGSAVFTMVTPETRQLGFATHVASRLGLRCTGQLSQVMEMGISGGLAFDQSAADIQLGRANFALALGAAYSTGGTPADGMLTGIRVVGDAQFQAPFGVTPIAWYAMDAMRYMHETGAERSALAEVAVKSRRAAMANELAQHRDPLTLQQVLSARPIVEPLGMYEVPAIADGAICLVLASADAARELGVPYVTVTGRGFSHDGRHQVGARPHDITDFESLRSASETALNQADVGLNDIDFAELYAPCTISEVLASEALGLFERGDGANAAADGRTDVDGDFPINTSGGCLSRGHPPALTGLYGLLEAREQLLGLAGARQVGKADVALTSCEAGNYNAAIVHILEAAA